MIAGEIRKAELSRQAVRVALATLILAFGLWCAVIAFPENFFLFRPAWLLHPPEQEHLLIARNLAETGSLSLSGEDLGPEYGSEHHTFIAGRYYPRSVIGPYLLYAIAFLFADNAWLLVTPFFGVATIVGMTLLVRRLTGSGLAGCTAGVLLATTSPFLMNATGLAVENVIALALIIWGCVALEAHRDSPSMGTGVAVGLLFAAIPLVRVDYAPVSLCAALVLSGPVWSSLRQRSFSGVTRCWRDVLSISLISAGCAAFLATNWLFYGSPFSTGYGSEAWQGSAEGVARNLLAPSIKDLASLIWSYMFQIGLPSTVLLLGGVVLRIHQRRGFNASELMLGALSLFLVYLHLSRAGANGNGEALLNLSPPRYLLPVYATGIVVGLVSLRQSITSAVLPGGAILIALAMVGSSLGLREAYTNPGGVQVVAPHLERMMTVQDFAYRYPDALFVGDLNTKAIISTPRLLIPRLQREPSVIVELIKREMSDGRRVFVVDDQRQLAQSRLNSGYMESLRQAGFITCAANEGPWVFQELVAPGQAVPADCLS